MAEIPASTFTHSYFSRLCALLEPDALEELQQDTFTYSVGAAETKYCIASWQTRLGSSGRMEVRDPTTPMALRNVSLVGTASGSTAYILNPSLPTYTSPRQTYYDRLLATDDAALKAVHVTATSQRALFLPGPYGSIITRAVNFNFAWVILRHQTVYGLNLGNEISDANIQRVDTALKMPVNKNIVNGFEAAGAGSTGNLGTLVYFDVPSTWSRVPDTKTYAFRDDFTGSSLNTAATWTRSQSTAGNIEIDTTWSWIKLIGNGTWGNNGCYSQASFARAAGKVFLVDCYTSTSQGGLLVGWGNGSGHAVAHFVHGVAFKGNGKISCFENGTELGEVGNWTGGCTYKVRITLGASGATYQIQGKEYAAMGSATWSTLSPSTPSSATTTPLRAALSAFSAVAPCYASDVRVYT